MLKPLSNEISLRDAHPRSFTIGIKQVGKHSLFKRFLLSISFDVSKGAHNK